MSCPADDTLLLDELGELPVNGREAVRAHVDGCRRCLAERTALRAMMADLRPAANANDDGPLFRAKVLAAASDVHWLYPAYRDERTTPRWVPIAAGSKPRLLGDVVQPEAPHAGPLRLVTLLAVSPLTVKDVEARLAQTPERQRGTADMG